MFPSLDYQIEEPLWLSYFASETTRLHDVGIDETDIERMFIVKVKNGVIYNLDDVFVVTDSKNKAQEIIIKEPKINKLTVINANKVKHKKLNRQLAVYLSTLHEFLMRMVKKGIIRIQIHDECDIIDMKEQLILKGDN